MNKTLTSADIKRMSQDEIMAFWKKRQIENRASGRDHYTVLIDAATDKVVCDIEQ